MNVNYLSVLKQNRGNPLQVIVRLEDSKRKKFRPKCEREEPCNLLENSRERRLFRPGQVVCCCFSWILWGTSNCFSVGDFFTFKRGFPIKRISLAWKGKPFLVLLGISRTKLICFFPFTTLQFGSSINRSAQLVGKRNTYLVINVVLCCCSLPSCEPVPCWRLDQDKEWSGPPFHRK